MKKYTIVALCGKAGSGKDTLLKELFRSLDKEKFKEVIHCTTRPIRENEEDGINYNFITQDEFLEDLNNGNIFEITEFNDWSYSTRFSDLDENKINIGVFNPISLEILKDYTLIPESEEDIQVNLYIIYILATKKERLIRQLTREENPNVDEIVRRYLADEQDFQEIDINLVDLVVNNNNFIPIENSVLKIKDFIQSLLDKNQ